MFRRHILTLESRPFPLQVFCRHPILLTTLSMQNISYFHQILSICNIQFINTSVCIRKDILSLLLISISVRKLAIYHNLTSCVINKVQSRAKSCNFLQQSARSNLHVIGMLISCLHSVQPKHTSIYLAHYHSEGRFCMIEPVVQLGYRCTSMLKFIS